MGYYHINDTGKGVIIKDFDKISKDYKMPPIDYIKEYFESKRGIGKKNLEWLASMDVYHQLAYLALNDYRLSYIVSNHHTIIGIDGIDYQIMIEADYLVNADESNFSGNNVRNMLEKVFKTETGKFLLQSMYQKRLNAEE